MKNIVILTTSYSDEYSHPYWVKKNVVENKMWLIRIKKNIHKKEFYDIVIMLSVKESTIYNSSTQLSMWGRKIRL